MLKYLLEVMSNLILKNYTKNNILDTISNMRIAINSDLIEKIKYLKLERFKDKK